MVNIDLICFGCMRPLEHPWTVCPHCGHDNTMRENDAGYLPAMLLQGQYFVGRALGRGGFGITYLGLDLSLDRVVAIKEYFPASLSTRMPDSRTLHAYNANMEEYQHGCEKAVEEGRIGARVGRLPNVVQIYNVFQANNTAYIVMEYIQGKTLAGYMKDMGGRLSWTELQRLMFPVIESLSKLHEMKIIHRDVSPDNIMIRQPENEAVLLDFGAAHTVSDKTMSEHSISLRLGYAPLEQYSRLGKQDGRIDEYAMCATMYYALTGQRPPDATERMYAGTEMTRPRQMGSDIPAYAENALMKGLSLRADERFLDMAALLSALQGRTRTNRSAAKAQKKKKGNAAVIVAAGVAVLGAAAGGVMLLNNAPKTPDTAPVTGGQSTAAATNTPAPTATAVPTPASVPNVELREHDFVAVTTSAGGCQIIEYEGAETSVRIPEMIQGVPVTGIQELHNERLAGIDIPACISYIQSGAFQNNPGLTMQVDESSPYFFMEDGQLIQRSDMRLMWAEEREHLVIAEGVKVLDPGAVMVGGVDPIIRLRRVTLPSTLESVGEYSPFMESTVEEIIVAQGNPYFRVQDGVLLRLDHAVAWPAERQQARVEIADGVTVIDQAAFFDAMVDEIVLPSTVTTIGVNAFTFTSAKTINVPASVTEIGQEAFLECHNLTLRVEAGSYAEQYAINNRIPYETYPAISQGSELAENGYIAEMRGDGTCVISGYTGTDTELNIPATIMDVPVYAIGDGAFMDNKRITKAVIPEGVALIGLHAFAECSGLQEVVLPESLREIGDIAFAITGLKNVHIPSGVANIKFGAFQFCEQLESISVDPANKNFQSLEGMLVRSSDMTLIASPHIDVDHLVVPEGIKRLGLERVDWASSDYSHYNWAAEHITLPASLEYLDGAVLRHTMYLQEVSIAEGNTRFWLTDDVLMNDTTVVSLRPKPTDGSPMKTAVIPEGATAIGPSAFLNGYFETVVIPDTVTSIGDYAFQAFMGPALTIPSSVTSIGEDAFEDFDGVLHVEAGSYAEEYAINNGINHVATATEEVGKTISFTTRNRQDGTCIITGMEGNGQIVDIPETIDGYTVTDIESLEPGIRGSYATVKIPATVKSMDFSLFYWPEDIGSVQVAENSQYYKMMNGMLVRLDDMAVQWTPAMTQEQLVVPEGVKVIEHGAIPQVNELYASYDGMGEMPVAHLHLSASLETFEAGEINLSNLASITVAEGNPNFYVEDGMLIFKTEFDQQVLAYPPMRDDTHIVIPEGVTVLSSNLFSRSNAQKIMIPASVRDIMGEVGDTTPFTDYRYTEFNGTLYVHEGSYAQQWANENGFRYELIGQEEVSFTTRNRQDGTCILTGVEYEGALVNLDIPYAIDGYTVTDIECTFDTLQELRSITLPADVKTIRDFAFSHCTWLENILVDEANPYYQATDGMLIRLEDMALVWASAADRDRLNIPEGVQRIAVDGLSSTVQQRETMGLPVKSMEVSFPSTLTNVPVPPFFYTNVSRVWLAEGNTSFWLGDNQLLMKDTTAIACPPLLEQDTVIVPDGTTYIDNYCFANSKVKHVVIPASVTSFGVDVFMNYEGLVVVEAGSYAEEYAISNGIPYSILTTDAAAAQTEEASEGFTGMLWPNGTTYELDSYTGSDVHVVIPAVHEGRAVNHLGAGLFQGQTQIISVVVPEGVKEISNNVFNGCTNLTKVVLPDSLSGCSRNAFDNCPNLTLIVNSGSFAERLATMWGIPYEVQDAPAATSSGDIRTGTGKGFAGDVIVRLTTDEQGAITWMEAEGPNETNGIGSVALESEAFMAQFIGKTGPIEEDDVDVVSGATYTSKGVIAAANDALSYGTDFVAVDHENGVTITGYMGDDSEVVIPAVIGGKAVTAIGEQAFEDNKTITNVYISDGITEVGYHAFAGCEQLAEVRLPETLTTIRDWAFGNCYSLKEIRIPASVSCIEDLMFANSNELNSIQVAEDSPYFAMIDGLLVEKATMKLLWTPINTMQDELIIPEGIKKLGKWTIRNAYTVVIPSTVEEIDDQAFIVGSDVRSYRVAENNRFFHVQDGLLMRGSIVFSCPRKIERKDIRLPAGTSRVEAYALLGMEGKNITVPGTAKEIGFQSFSFCSNGSIVLEEGVESLDSCAFSDLENMTVTLPASVKEIGHEVFSNPRENVVFRVVEGSLVQQYMDEQGIAYEVISEEKASPETDFEVVGNGSGVSISKYVGNGGKVVIPAKIAGESVNAIGEKAFAQCETLEAVIVPEGVKEINTSAFYQCAKLQSVQLPSTLTYLGKRVFYGCDLRAFNVPANLETIEESFLGNNFNLDVISVDAQNDRFAMMNGFLVNTGTMHILWVKPGTEGDLIIPEGIRGIDEGAFLNYGGIQRVQLPASLHEMQSNVFFSTNLAEITLPSGNSSGFYLDGAMLMHGDEAVCFPSYSSVKSYRLPEGATKILRAAFSGVEGMEITIPGTVKLIDYSAFEHVNGCNILLEEGVEEIYGFAFHGASNCIITIPDSVKSIDIDAFLNTENVTIRVEEGSYAQQYMAQQGIACETIPAPTPEPTATPTPAPFSSNGYQAAYNEDGSLTITAYSGNSKTLKIPAAFKNVPVTLIGDSAFAGNRNISEVVIPEGVTVIGDKAFNGCLVLNHLTLSSTLTSIGQDAFNSCKMHVLEIPESVASLGKGAFKNNIVLHTLSLPASIGEVGDSVFANCDSLAHVYMAEGIHALGTSAFEACKSLTHIKLPSTLTRIGDRAFQSCNLQFIEIPGNVKSIGSSAFYENTELSSVMLPEGLESIGASAFRKCEGLTSLVIPSTVTSIGDKAFEGCKNIQLQVYKDSYAEQYAREAGVFYKLVDEDTAMYTTEPSFFESGDFVLQHNADGGVTIRGFKGTGTKVKIPAEVDGLPVTAIGLGAFQQMWEITSVEIPKSVTEIGDYAFAGCGGLKSIAIPSGVKKIGRCAFKGIDSLTSLSFKGNELEIGEEAFYFCYNLKTLDFSNCIVSIGERAFSETALTTVNFSGGELREAGWAFSGCVNLSKVKLPQGMTEISDMMFYGCEKLSSITIPDGVTRIGSQAFDGCGLTSIKLPDSVTSIGNYAFGGCEKLGSATIPAGVGQIADNAFEGCSKVVLSVYRYSYGERYAQEQGVKSKIIGDAATATPQPTATPEPQPFSANGYDVDYNEDGTLIIVKYNGKTADLKIPDKINGIPVTAIGDYAIPGGDNWLRSLTIPEGVTAIGDYAFHMQYGLNSLTLPSTLKSIGEGAFEHTYMEDVTLPEGLTEMGQYAFRGANCLKTVVLPSTLKQIPDSAFEECTRLVDVTIPEGVSVIGERAFFGDYFLMDIVLPSTLEQISGSAFSGCDLREVNVPEAVRWIGSRVFANNANMESVNLIGQLEHIGESAFHNCTGLDAVHMSDGVKEIGENAFAGCDLARFYVDEGAYAQQYLAENGIACQTHDQDPMVDGDYEIEVNANGTCTITGYTGKDVELVIPETIAGRTVARIGWSVFNGKQLTGVVLPETIVAIGDMAFGAPGDGFTVVIPASVQKIGGSAFYNAETGSIRVDENNKRFAIMDGMLVDTYTMTLLWVPGDCKAQLVIPEGIRHIEELNLFADVKTLTLPASLVSINPDNCTSLDMLQQIKAAAGNEFFKVQNGVLIRGKTVVWCPAKISAASIQIPDGFTKIGARAFWGVTDKKITVPGSVKVVDEYAFGCADRSTITFQEGVQAIGGGCFINMNDSIITFPASIVRFDDSLNWEYGGKDSTFRVVEGSYMQQVLDEQGISYELVKGKTSQVLNDADFTAVLEADNTLTLTGYMGPGGTAEVPQTLGGRKVAAIAGGAFASRADVRRISIPAGVERIAADAFADCGDVLLIVSKGTAADAFARQQGLDRAYRRESRG